MARAAAWNAGMKYELRVSDEIGQVLTIPLDLDGSEDDSVAVARFNDAICVARVMFAEKWGTEVSRTIDLRSRKVVGRLDGFPRDV